MDSAAELSADDADRPLEWPRSFRGWLIFPALAAIRLYQLGLRPLLPVTCRYHPSCSRYSVEAFRVHGVWRGFGLTLWRLLRCQPLGGYGYDPVPPPADGAPAHGEQERSGRSRA